MNLLDRFLAPFKESKRSTVILSIIVGILIGKGISWAIVNGIMPHIGVFAGGADFTNMKIVLNEESVNDLGNIIPATAWNIGNLFQKGIDIIFILFSIFFCMKLFTSFAKTNNNNIETEEAVVIPIATEEEKFIHHAKRYDAVESE